METDLITYLQKFNTWIICHILCVKRYMYSNNNLFRTNLERFIITTEVTTGMSLNYILCCFNSSTNWEFDGAIQAMCLLIVTLYRWSAGGLEISACLAWSGQVSV